MFNDKKVILAVDNAVMFLNSLERYLEKEPYTLHCSTSGAEALSFLDQNRADLILMDAEMPGMDGYELTRKIRGRGIRTPVVFITAAAEPEEVEKALATGANGILAKPFQRSQLIEKIREYL
jgi:CheY-like chemotaxis protein